MDALSPALEDPYDRPLFVTTPIMVEQDAMISRGLKYVLDHRGRDRLHSLASKAGERVDLKHAHRDLAEECRARLLRWRAVQLGYFGRPEYRRAYFPPRH